MRRFGLLVLVLVLIFNWHRIGTRQAGYGDLGQARGMVTNIVKKKKITNYYMGKVLAVDFSGKDRGVHIGDRLCLYGKSRDLNNFIIKDFDYGRYLKSRGIDTYIEVSNLDIYGRSGLYYRIGSLKDYCIGANKFMYKAYGDILNSIVLGYRGDLDKDVVYTFRDAGVSHVMSISGLHISILVGIFLVLVGRINKLDRLGLLFVGLIFYNILVGGGPSITRSIGLSVLGALAYFVDRRLDPINILALIASIMIYLNPYIIYNISFQLSFLAVLSIVIYSKYLRKYIYFNFLNTCLAANILTFPLVVYNFKTFSMVGLIGNILVLPFIGLIVFLDMISLLLYGISLDLALLVAYINEAILRPLYYYLEKLANYGVYNMEVRSMNPLLLLAYYIGVLGLAIFLEIYYIKVNKTD
ncbi:ComEC/Rec2 family competence protein [Peptostreptococcus stomatis]|uniref:ComEC/Rec2 family competence protein n=1 Tax=Peptostreptococcus stomatis TaxID=341694 RepID=UPI003FA04970